MLILQLRNDPGLGHCNRMIRFQKFKLSQNRSSIILVPDLKEMILYLRNNNIHSILKYDISLSPDELILLVDKFVGLNQIKEWIIDTKFDCFEILMILREKKITSTLVDNATKSRLLSNKNIYPTPLFNKNDMNWNDYTGIIEGGLEVMNKFMNFPKSRPNFTKNTHRILISFGGEDPNKLTVHTMKCLAKLDDYIKILIVIGPFFKHRNQIKDLNSDLGDRFELLENCYDLSNVIFTTDFLITAIGTTLFEAIAIKKSCIVISNYSWDRSDEIKLSKFENVTIIGHFKKIIEDKNLLLDILKKKLSNSI